MSNPCDAYETVLGCDLCDEADETDRCIAICKTKANRCKRRTIDGLTCWQHSFEREDEDEEEKLPLAQPPLTRSKHGVELLRIWNTRKENSGQAINIFFQTELPDNFYRLPSPTQNEIKRIRQAFQRLLVKGFKKMNKRKRSEATMKTLNNVFRDEFAVIMEYL